MDQYILLFSGHWCPPSRQFTPQLVEAYNSVYNNVKHKFDIVFISWDADEESFDHYYQQMPWKALPFEGKLISLLETIKISLTIQMVPSCW